MYEIMFVPKISEISLNEKVKFTSLIDYLQHSAYKHADLLGVGHQQIFHKNLTWLLLRHTVEIIQYPTLEDEVKVITWVAESGSSRYTLREFEIYDSQSNLFCKATTSWLLFNYRKRQIVDFKNFWPDFKAEEKRAINYDFPKLPLPEKIDNRKLMKVRLHDLDINQHVNHRVNIEWIIDSMPQKIQKKYELSKLEISYKDQAFYEEEVVVGTEILKNQENKQIKAIHQITKGKKEKLVSKAITYWRLQE